MIPDFGRNATTVLQITALPPYEWPFFKLSHDVLSPSSAVNGHQTTWTLLESIQCL